MRLIDADILFAELNEKKIHWNRRINDIIMNLPTAYDADKVVEQIYKEQEREFINNEVAIGDITCSEVIKIVKGGGVDA